MYPIGTKVYCSTFDAREQRSICPECCGERRLKVTMGDDTEHWIPCEGCRVGGIGGVSTGQISYYAHIARVTSGTVIECRVSEKEIEYTIDCHIDGYRRIFKESNVFVTDALASLRAQELAEAHSKAEEASLYKKVYPNQSRSWSWHVHYYRRQIREAKKTIERAEKMLAVARIKAKEPDETEAK